MPTPEKTFTIEDLYRVLSPDGLSESIPVNGSTTIETLDSKLSGLLMSTNGAYKTWSQIKQSVDSFYAATQDKERTKSAIHGIGSDSTKLSVGDDEFWTVVNPSAPPKAPATVIISKVKDFVPSLPDATAPSTGDKALPNVSTVVIRGSFVSPSTRGTDAVNVFMNYIPPVVIHQMVPHLNVEFEITRSTSEAASTYMTTPTITRFLLGSVDSKDPNVAANDKLLATIEQTTPLVKPGDSSKTYTSKTYSGMENFLFPQTLTNFDGLGPSAARLVRARPFLPFASIEALEIQTVNAGAGKFAHKKGTLRLKIHDKSRISEMSDFIKGSSGFREVLVWTTYGWLAPRGRGDSDPYCDFINDNMLTRDCWKIMNTQFQFDASGQVSLTLELVNNSVKSLSPITIDLDPTDGPAGLGAKLSDFNKLCETVRDMKARLSTSSKFNVPMGMEEFLNAAATTGDFSGLKDANVSEIVKSLTAAAAKTGSLTTDEVNKFKEALAALTATTAVKGKKGTVTKSAQIDSDIVNVIKEKFDSLGRTPDPFLPDAARLEKWWPNSYLSDAINEFKSKDIQDAQAAVLAKSSALSGNPIKINPQALVVSFGKLFLNFVLPAMTTARNTDEIEVIFYGLNDSCGPVSSLSVAEFPIDVTKLAYAYAKKTREKNTDTLQLEEFMTLVVENQFADIRSIGYGMNSFYKPSDYAKKEDPSLKEGKGDKAKIESGLLAWTSKFGDMQIPVIDFLIETGNNTMPSTALVKGLSTGIKATVDQSAPSPAGNVKITRIHIYDKQNNPYKMFQSFVDEGGGNLTVGSIDTAKLKADLKAAALKFKPGKDGKTFAEKINAELASGGIDKALAAAGGKTLAEYKTSPSGVETIRLQGNRKVLRDYLMRYVPVISVGSNGTTVISANIASKTDSTQGAINLINAMKGAKSGNATTETNGLEELGHLPMRVVPAQLTLSTLGIPNAQLYQSYFVDFNTGTSLDNLYVCSQINHSIAPGKFTTAWTFIYTNGYGKFTSPPSFQQLATGALSSALDEITTPEKKKK